MGRTSIFSAYAFTMFLQTKLTKLYFWNYEEGTYYSGDVVTRERFETAEVNSPASCQQETQSTTCTDGSWSEWSGDFTHSSCYTNSTAKVHQSGSLFFEQKLMLKFAS